MSKPVLGGKEIVKVAIAQISNQYLNKTASAEIAARTIREAAANGSQLVVFPEVWLAGYPYWTEGWDTELAQWIPGRSQWYDNAILVGSSDTEPVSQAIKETGVYVVMGCNEIDERPEASTIYNTMLFFNKDGSLMGKHRKLMPTFSERLYWGQGNSNDLVAFDTDIGRIGGLICGEHLITLLRAYMIAQGEEIHVALFPGSFAMHTGPRLEEEDKDGSSFWGYSSVRAHALEAGAFVVNAVAYQDPSSVADTFPYKDKMNTSYANGGSTVVAPLAIDMVQPTKGDQIIYADLPAWMIKAAKSIVDTWGHYGRPDILRLMIREEAGWKEVKSKLINKKTNHFAKSADDHEVELDKVDEMYDQMKKELMETKSED